MANRRYGRLKIFITCEGLGVAVPELGEFVGEAVGCTDDAEFFDAARRGLDVVGEMARQMVSGYGL